MIELDSHYGTANRPMDANGIKLEPLDLVRLNDIPKHYWEEEGLKHLRNFQGGYGLLTFFDNHRVFQGRHPGWYNERSGKVYVVSRNIIDGEVVTFDFWVAANTLTRLPHNFLIMGVFSEFVWQIERDDGSSDMFVVQGMSKFELVRMILNAPYEKLVEAHQAAVTVIGEGMTTAAGVGTPSVQE